MPVREKSVPMQQTKCARKADKVCRLKRKKRAAQRLSISINHEIFIKNPAPGLRYSGASFIISETVSILLSDIGTIFDFINPAFRHKEGSSREET